MAKKIKNKALMSLLVLSLSIYFLIFLDQRDAYASNWQEPSSNTITLQFGAITPTLNLNLQPPDEISKDTLKYSPFNRSNTFLSVDYQNVGLTVSSANPTEESKRDIYGETKRTDFQLRFYGTKFSYEFFFQEYQGYYTENASSVDPTITSDMPQLLRPDIVTSHYGGTVIYNFQPDNYSLAAAYSHAQRQIVSGGSWLGYLSINRHSIKGDSPLIPTQWQAQMGSLGNLVSGTFDSISLGGGYGYTLTASGFYLTGLLIVGGGQQTQTVKYLSETKNKVIPISKISPRMGIGYNGDKNIFGLQWIIDQTTFPLDQGKINILTQEISLFIGHRF